MKMVDMRKSGLLYISLLASTALLPMALHAEEKPLSMRLRPPTQAAAPAQPAVSKPATPTEQQPAAADVEADELNYDTKASTIEAQGNVVVKYQERVLKAHKIEYNQQTRQIDATDNLQFTDETGNTFYADKATVDDQLKAGTVEPVQGVMKDNSRIAAVKGIRENPDLMHMEEVVYSPCSLCDKDKQPTKPLWRVRADKVTLDDVEQRITYENARLEFKDVPVFYTPYFSHPAPGAPAKSGLLTPSYSSSSTLGVMVKTPYYVALAPDKDLTLEPVFTTEEGPILGGEFRHALPSGKYYVGGSITNPSQRDEFGRPIAGHDLRGHIQGAGHFDITDTTSWGFDGKRSTDDTYLQRYKFGNEDLLTSRAYVENIDNHNYIGAQAVTFQGLNAQDDPDTTPYALPWVRASYEGNTGFHNMLWQLTGDSLILNRSEGINSRRLSTTGGLLLPVTTAGGHVFEFATSLRTDGYSVDNAKSIGSTQEEGLAGRVIPEARATWHYPLMEAGDHHQVVLEPVVDLITSPNGNNPNDIPNEDSRDLEISDTNLFSDNRFSGIDRVEGGNRTNYGFRGNAAYDNTMLDFLVGQNYRTSTDKHFTPQSGLDDNFSDYAGRVTVSQSDIASLGYRFRVDKETYDLRRSEVNSALNFKPISLYLDYLNLNEDEENIDRKELSGRLGYRFYENWEAYTGGRRDLSKKDGSWINTRIGLQYDDECLILATEFGRDFIRDRDIEPSTTFMVRLGFKNLGEF